MILEANLIAKYLWETGSIIIALMGALHLRGTLFTDKLHPRSKQLMEDMEVSPLKLTDKLTMWKSWIGFNATHSIGAVFVGGMSFYLAFRYFDLLKSDHFISIFTVGTIGFYAWVAHRYWFNVVLIPISIAWACFIASSVLMLL